MVSARPLQQLQMLIDLAVRKPAHGAPHSSSLTSVAAMLLRLVMEALR